MKTITIAPGVKLVLDEECDRCKDLQEQVGRLAEQAVKYDILVESIKSLIPKEEKYMWDKGYNQCMKDLKKRIEG